jgi:AraC-like DNA-binding protein
VNFSSYVWRLRYEKSRLLLATTNYSIEKIGALVGYDNASSFRRKFKDECGVSPSQYRKKARETPDMQPG